MFKRICTLLLVLDVLLGLGHVLWPEYVWGQGRDSYFYLGNQLTLASWLASMQLAGLGLLGLVAFHRERRRERVAGRWVWIAGTTLALGLSFVEFSRLHQRLGLWGYPDPNVYERMVVAALSLCLLVLFGAFLAGRLRDAADRRFALAGIAAWAAWALLAFVQPWTYDRFRLIVDLDLGLALLAGCTLLLRGVGGQALAAAAAPDPDPLPGPAPYPTARGARNWILVGVGGATFSIIFLQIIVFQLLTISADYLTAHTALSVALLGISVGGLIGFFTAERCPLATMIGAAMLLPLTILAAFGAAVSHMGTPLVASILLTLPFVCCSTAITVALARSESHLVYFIDLLGAAVGAFLVGAALSRFREESSLLLLCAFGLLVAGCFVMAHPSPRLRRLLAAPLLAGLLGFGVAGALNLDRDWLNVVRTNMQESYPQVEMLFSKSSFVGRYDIVRYTPNSNTLKAIENGRTIDTIRDWTEEAYQIDPRLPHTLMDDPVILILGLSGDAITKTAKLRGEQVIGLEINPAIVRLQSHELRDLNGRSYEGIDVVMMDGRTYVEQSERRFDMITLLNAHFAKGYITGRSASPEYLQTVEAMGAYLDHLTDRGVVNIEEPVGQPGRETPVWKLLLTMRQALLDRGAQDPARHFFVFQWKTQRNNYYQILMKKTPFTPADLDNLRAWLLQVDGLRQAEQAAGRQLGPIDAVTTVLYAPDGTFETNVARLIEGRAPQGFRSAHNLVVTTDDRPFPFDVDPARRETKRAYTRTLWMLLLLVPFFGLFLARHRAQLQSALPYVAVVGLTGMGYLLIEVVLIQRYAVYIGSPVAAFATVLGSLLVFSGLGSLWSGRIGSRALFLALALLFAMLLSQLALVPWLLGKIGATALPPKLLLTVLSLAPLAFFMGVPFPFVLRTGKTRFSDSAAAMLFAINAATSALAVPLALNVSVAWGMRQVLLVALVVYAAVALSLIGAQRPRFLAWANGSACALLAVLLVSPWLLARPLPAGPDTDPRYEVFGLTCGDSYHREDKVLLGGSARRQVPFEWLFWLVRGEGRTVLVDTGFDAPDLVERWNVADHVKPLDRLAQLGLRPEDVTDVVLTHTHWDHIGGLRDFGNARIFIQEQEYAHGRSLLGPGSPSRNGMRWEDFQLVLQAEEQGRLVRVEGEFDLAPGFSMNLGGAHTPGMQYVTVQTTDGPVIIAGDTTYLYWNNQRHVPIGTAIDYDANLRTIRELHRKAASPFLILPGHDPRVIRFFPVVSDGIVRVTAGVE